MSEGIYKPRNQGEEREALLVKVAYLLNIKGSNFLGYSPEKRKELVVSVLEKVSNYEFTVEGDPKLDFSQRKIMIAKTRELKEKLLTAAIDAKILEPSDAVLYN